MCTDCNGTSIPQGPPGSQGTPGVNGTNGTDGTCTGILITDVTACSNGGKHIQVGIDTDCDGIINTVLYDFDMCNGLNGTNGTDSTAPFDGTGGGIIMYDGNFLDPTLWIQAPDPEQGLGIGPMNGWGACIGVTLNTIFCPDLRGRFPLGAGQNQTPFAGDINPTYTVGQTVNTGTGQNQVPLIKSDIPRHQHALNGDFGTSTSNISGGAHDHTYDKYVSDGGPIDGDNGPNDFSYVGTNTSTNTHNHPTSDFSGSTGDGRDSGVGINGAPPNVTKHENRPPFYALNFIKRII